MSIPFWKGKDAKVIFFQDGKQIPVDVDSWSVKPNVTDIADGVCGEERDRLDYEINYYDINLECKQQTTDALEAVLDDGDNQDAHVLPLDKSVAFSLKCNDGTNRAFAAGGDVTIGAWDFSAGGRTERNKFTLPLRSQYFKKIKTT